MSMRNVTESIVTYQHITGSATQLIFFTIRINYTINYFGKEPKLGIKIWGSQSPLTCNSLSVTAAFLTNFQFFLFPGIKQALVVVYL